MLKKCLIGVFFLCLILFFTLTVLVPRDEAASVLENRPLAEMPKLTVSSWFSGEFGADFEEYLSDNVGFRSFFTKLGAKIENLCGFTREAVGQLVTLPSGYQLALDGGKIMEIFRAKPDVSASYAEALNALAAALPDGANMYLALVPTQIEFSDSEYRKLSDSEKDTIDAVYSSLTGVEGVNVYDKLRENAGSYVYFRTDHHWTQRGAYLGYEVLMEAIGETPIPISRMKADKRSGFLGYLYNQANVPEYAEFSDEIEFFLPGQNYTVNACETVNGVINEYSSRIVQIPPEGAVPQYAIFMGGDHAFARVDTDVKNGKTALIVKDSYANALIPFLTSHYETILVIDPRSFDGSVTELVSKYGINDVIVVNYVFTTTFPDFVANVNRIR